MDINALRDGFLHPPAGFSPLPFWFWNDTLSEAELTRQIDDFLAHGEALRGLMNGIEQAGASVVGACIVVEKAYPHGADDLRAAGMQIESLARVASMDDVAGTVEFIED